MIYRMVAAATRLIVRQVREEHVGFAPLTEGTSRVDRDAGVIFGCKVVGRKSPNTHGVTGAEGTEYTLEALQRALPLYRDINVNVDHPPRERPHAERSAHDRWAWLTDVYVTESGIYGNLNFLDPTDALAVKMLNAAERKPDAFALSHNATGRGEVRNGRYVITEIPEVRSVDIVADGGTNRSLFEGKEIEQTLKQLLEAAATDQYPKLRKLLEMDDAYGEMPVMDANAGTDPDEADHLFQAFKACADPAKKNKILALLKHEMEAPETPAVEGEEDEDDMEEMPEVKESRKPKKSTRGTLLQESEVKSLLRVSKVKESPKLLQVLRESGTTTKALAIIETIQDMAASTAPAPTTGTARAPRSVSPQQLTEARHATGKAPAKPTSGKSLAETILRN